MRLDVLLKLSQGALGLFECQEVFLSIDRTDQFVLGDFEFGAAYRVFCFQKSGLILGCLDVGIGLGFDYLLFRLCEVTPVLSKVVFLLAGVKFKHDVPRVHLGAGAGQRDDLQGAAGDRWSGDGSRLRRAQGARGKNLELQIGFFHGGCGNLRVGGEDRRLAAGCATCTQRQQQKKRGFF